MSDVDDNRPVEPVESAEPSPAPANTYEEPAARSPETRPVTASSAPRSGTGKLILGLLLGGVVMAIVVLVIAAVVVSARDDSGRVAIGRGKVGILPIEGEIVESRATLRELEAFAENDSIKAIVVRINSPGGAVAPSQEIHRELKRVREETGKPIIASLDTVAASGGYYIAVGCQEIIANEGSITGSIGVIAQWFNVEKLVEWARVSPQTFTSGELKDAGSPFRPMNDQEKAYYQRIVTQLHGQFVQAVIDGRKGKMDAEKVRSIADGRVFTGQEANDLKLVDEIGGLEDAVRRAAALASIDGDPAVIYPKKEKPGLLELLAESKTSTPAIVERFFAGKVSPFLYRW
ncbi:MAG: signal peptide peptidase SppA [Acidobacteria bacterium]|nr:signal peptide peptidase SppA [Acidobacteriota bacterium]